MSERVEKLRDLGVSESVIALAGGSSVHHSFRDLVFDDESRPVSDFAFPEGYPEFVPITQRYESVIGCWLRDEQLEFISVELGEYPEHRVIAHSEQGLWFWLFVDVIDSGKSGRWQDEEEAMAELREIAAITGFVSLDDAWGFQSQYDGDHDALDEKCRSIA